MGYGRSHETINDSDLCELLRLMANLIAKVSDPSHRVLLELRYLGGNTWEEIALKMGYDVRWIYRLHGRALQAVELVLRERLSLNV